MGNFPLSLGNVRAAGLQSLPLSFPRDAHFCCQGERGGNETQRGQRLSESHTAGLRQSRSSSRPVTTAGSFIECSENVAGSVLITSPTSHGAFTPTPWEPRKYWEAPEGGCHQARWARTEVVEAGLAARGQCPPLAVPTQKSEGILGKQLLPLGPTRGLWPEQICTPWEATLFLLSGSSTPTL